MARRDEGGAVVTAWLIGCLATFYRWAIEMGHLGADPTRRIQRPPKRQTLPRPIRSRDLVTAIDRAEPVMRAWLLLGALEGLRCKEIAGLSHEDVIEDEGLLRVVHGKGRKQRMVPLHDDVLAALTALPMPRRGPLFRRPDGHPYSPAKLSEYVCAHLKACGSGSTAHALRHWFGTEPYRASHDLRLVGDLLGHSSPVTTAGYAAANPDSARPVVTGLRIVRGKA